MPRTTRAPSSAVSRIAEPPDPMQDLAAAIEANDTIRVKTLLAGDPAIRARLNDALPGDAFGATALLRAVGARNRSMIELLLDAGADINVKSHWWAGGFGVL